MKQNNINKVTDNQYEESEVQQWSEDAEVKYYGDAGVRVENYDTEVGFDEPQGYQASVSIDENGNITITPFGAKEGGRRGPRAITVCDTGIARIRKSPKSKNIRLDVLLPSELASEKNFRHHINDLFEKVREHGINLKNC